MAVSVVRWSAASAFFFVLAFFGWSQACRGPERFSEVVQRKVTNMQGDAASRSFLFEHDCDGAAFDAVAESDPTTASESCVCKALEHMTTLKRHI